MIRYPCKDCGSRKVGCHGKCIEYKEAAEQNHLIRSNRNTVKIRERIGISESKQRCKHRPIGTKVFKCHKK